MRPRPFSRFETHILEGKFCDVANALGFAMDRGDAIQAQRLRAQLSLIDEEMTHRPNERTRFYQRMLRCFIPVGEVHAAAITMNLDRADTISVLEPVAIASAKDLAPSDLWVRMEARRLLAGAGISLEALDRGGVSFWEREGLVDLAGFLEDFLLVRLVEGGEVDELVLKRDHEVFLHREDPRESWAALVAQAARLLAMSPFPRTEVETASDHAFASDDACRAWLVDVLRRTADRLGASSTTLPLVLRGGAA